MTFVDFTSTAFSVDDNRRTIRGVGVPWGKVGRHSNGDQWVFPRGSLAYAHPKFVRFNNDHRVQEGLGRAIEIEDTEEGLVMTFKVNPGPEGDRQLALAKSGRKTGLSVEVEIDPSDMQDDPENPGAVLVNLAHLTAVGFVKDPAFTDSRLISVMANKEGKESGMDPEETTETASPAPQPVTFSADQFDQLLGRIGTPTPATGPEVIDPTAGRVEVREPLPYRFSYEGGRHTFAEGPNGYDFSKDLFALIKDNGQGVDAHDAQARINALIKATFDVDRADTAALSPNRHRPDLWQPQMDYPTPLWDMINSGSTDGTAFDVPKFNSSSGLVAPAVEGVEPAPGAYTTTLQTITPTQVWGKVEITRQDARRTASPQLSGILWDQMLREYYEDREAAVATFLNTLTAAADIVLPGVDAAPDNDEYQANAAALEAAIADLQFARGGNRFRAFAVHQALYRLLARVTDDSGRPLYPQINPMNANGTSQTLFSTMNIAGTTAVGAYALGTPGGNTSVNSWLFDPAKVRGWASAPEQLNWNFGATVQTANIPQLSHVTIGIYGDIALANLDINGVRQVIFDQNTAA